MSLILFLFAIGIVMILLEVFLPGGVLGVLGAGAMVAGSVVAFREYGFGGGVLAVVAGAILVTGSIILEFIILPRTAWGRRLYLSASVTGAATRPAEGDAALIGRECEAATVLAPSGLVLLDGRKREAFCRDGFAETGARLIVRGADNFRLIVSKS